MGGAGGGRDACGRRGVLEREGDGEVVHEGDGMAAGSWDEGDSLEVEGRGEEVLIARFVVVCECCDQRWR